ncbi:MFS general substrate transporter [Daldinia caldariorum]|uniref:MFS general substrate transporter n=1 Tax=Daldinia caldariorum TaxID=326644 RepID=UPI002007B56E|nr:MFS general substrate transporter [Daldinia caldariorum]KAI1464570.1 MFS general substrate transporter [Daldinia caldariorum]
MSEDRGTHLVRSHAHEEDIPGTVNVQTVEGDDSYNGQALFPVPAEDPNDPLQWPKSKKITILVVICAYSFLGNSALLGPGPYLKLWSELFDITPAEASTLISYPNLAYGFSSFVLVPLYLKFGRRPVMLGSLLAFIAGLAACSRANDFGALMLVVSQTISRHHMPAPGSEFEGRDELYTALVPAYAKPYLFNLFGMCFASMATIPAAYMLPTKYSWRLFFYVIIALAVTLFILAFLVVEESSYDREAHISRDTSTERSHDTASNAFEKPNESVVEQTASVPRRKSFLSTLSPWGRIDPEVYLHTFLWRPFTYFLVPQVLWVVTSFGTIIGLGALAFNYVFPIKITAPPYNWSQASSGVHSLGPLLGFLLALPFTSSSDRLAGYLTRRNNGIREAEMRLGVMLPAMIIGPAGLVVYGFTAELNLHWIGYFIGSGLASFGGYFYYCFTLAYAVDSYNSNTSEMLVAINVGKQAVSFGLGYGVLDWVTESGYAVIIAGAFGGVFLANNLMLVVFLLRGKQIRRFMLNIRTKYGF